MSAYLSVRLSSCLYIGSSFSLSLSLSPAATVVTEADSHMDSEPSKQLVEREEEGSCDSGGVVMSMSCDPVAIENESTAERNAGEMKIESEVRVRGMVAESVGEMGRGSRVGSEQGQVLGVSLESVVVGDVESESMVCDSVAGVQHGELTVSTGEEDQEKVPLSDTHYATQGVSERSCDMEGSSCNVQVDSHDQSHDKDERSCDMQVESHDKDRSQDMQVESHDKDRSHDMQVESHGKEVRSHDMQVESHDKEVRSHDMQLESHDKEVRSHDMQLESHDKKERSHDMQLQSHDKEESHDRKVESLDKDEGSDDTEMVSRDISESQSDSMERKSYTDDIQGTSHTEHSHRVHVESGDIESKSRDVQWKSDYVQEESQDTGSLSTNLQRTYGEEPVNRDLLVSTDVSSHDLHQISHGFEAESHSAVGIPHATDEKLTDPTLEHGELCDMANSSLEVQVGSGDEWVEQQEAGQPHPPDEIQEYREFEETKLQELRQSHNKVGAEISLETDAGSHDVQEAITPLGTTQPHSEESSTAGCKEHEEQVSATEGLVQRVSYGESQDVPPHSAEEGVGAEKRCLLEEAVESGNKEDGGHLVPYDEGVHQERASRYQERELCDGMESRKEASHDQERESHDPPSHDQEESHDMQGESKEASHDQERESHDPPREASHDQEKESHDMQKEASHDQERESHDPPKEASHRESHDPSHDQERESHDPPKASHDQERESHDPPKEALHNQAKESRDMQGGSKEASHDQEESHDMQGESKEASHDQERESHDMQGEASHDQERESHDIQGESHDQEKESHDMQGESKEASRDQNRNSHDHQERMEVVVPDRTAEPPPSTAPGEVNHSLNETDSIDRMLESSVDDSLQQKSHDTVMTLVQGDGPLSEETAVSYGETTLPNADQAVRENQASRAEAEMETQTAVDEGQEHSGEEAMELDQVGDNWGNPSHLASIDPQSSGNVPCESQGGDDQNNNKNTVHQQTHHTGSEVHSASDRLQRMSHDGETRSHDTGFKSCDPGVDEESTPQPMETESEIREVHSSEGTVATAVQGESYQKEAVPADGAKPHEQSCDEEAKSYEQSHDEEAKSHEQAHVEEAKSHEESRDDEAKSRDEEVKSHEQPHDEEAKPLNEEGKSHEQSCDEGAKSHDHSKVGESESHTTEYQLVQRQTESHGIIAGDTSSTTSAMIEESCEDTGDSAGNSEDIVPMVEGELSSQEELHGSRVGGSEVDSQEELHGSRGGGSSDGDTRGGVCQSQEETEGALYPSYAATEVCSLDRETKIDGKLPHNPGSESPDLPNQPSEEEEQSYTDTQSRSHDGGTEVCGDQEPMLQVGEQDSHETEEKSGDSDSKPSDQTDGGNEPITHSREPADISDGRDFDSTNARGFDNSNAISPDSELKSHDNKPKSHESQPESRDSESRSHDTELKSRDSEVESHDTKLKACDTESKSKSHDIELKSRHTDLKSHDIELESCDTELKSHDTELKSHDSELSSRDTEPLKAHESELKPHDPPSHELKSLENETQSSNYESSECEGERLDDVKPSGNDVTSDIEGVSCEAEAKEEVGGACVTMETVEEREFTAASNRVVSMATELLEKWEGLKEVFRIPKRTQSVSEIHACMYTECSGTVCIQKWRASFVAIHILIMYIH